MKLEEFADTYSDDLLCLRQARDALLDHPLRQENPFVVNAAMCRTLALLTAERGGLPRGPGHDDPRGPRGEVPFDEAAEGLEIQLAIAKRTHDGDERTAELTHASPPSSP